MSETTTFTRPQARQVDLSEQRQLLSDLELIDRVISDYEKQRKALRTRLAEIIGEGGVGMLDGQPVYGYGPTDRFASKTFADENPEIAAQFMTQRVVHELNVEMLKLAEPALYEAYRVRSLRPMGSKN